MCWCAWGIPCPLYSCITAFACYEEEDDAFISRDKNRQKSCALMPLDAESGRYGVYMTKCAPAGRGCVMVFDDDAEPTWTCNSVLRHGCDVLSVALSDAFCVSGARDGGVRVWAPHDDERLVHALRAPQNDETNEQWGAVRCLAFSGDRERVWAGSDDGYVRQFVVSTGELMLRFRAHASRLYDVAFSPELNLLASCGQDQLLKLWRGDVEVDAARNGRRRSELVASVSPGDSSNSEVLAMFDSEEKEGDDLSESELAMIESEEEEGDEFCTLSASE